MLLVIVGINGKMGRRLYNLYKDNYEIIGIDINHHPDVLTYSKIEDIDKKIDIVFDFSNPSAIDNIMYALKHNIIVVSGTTGYSKKDIRKLKRIGKDNFYWSCNYAKGIPLFTKLLKACVSEYDIYDFVEIHASTKKDAPSGTAKMIADELNIPYDKIQSLRIENAPAIHEIIYSSKNERITIKHEVINPQAFLDGFDHTVNQILKKEK